MQVNIYDAKTNLSALLERARSGEEVVIARAGKPVARLVPISPSGTKSGVKLGGLQHLRGSVSPDFHARLTDDDLLGP